MFHYGHEISRASVAGDTGVVSESWEPLLQLVGLQAILTNVIVDQNSDSVLCCSFVDLHFETPSPRDGAFQCTETS